MYICLRFFFSFNVQHIYLRYKLKQQSIKSTKKNQQHTTSCKSNKVLQSRDDDDNGQINIYMFYNMP
jgi:hypothetical protein